MTGYTSKRATRAALFSDAGDTEDLKYEIVWRDSFLDDGMPSADFLTTPSAVDEDSAPFSAYLDAEGVAMDSRRGLLDDLERLSWKYSIIALERLGWTRQAGELVDSEALRNRLNVLDEHVSLFRQLFRLLARAGVVQETDAGLFLVQVGPHDPLPDNIPADVDEFADWMTREYPHGVNEIGVFRRSAGTLADALVGRADPLTLLFSSGDPTAADLYLKAPAARAANRLIGDTVAMLLKDLPEGRRVRVLEVGAGTGSATASVLPELPAGRFEYTYTDVSAGFFSEAEERFGHGGGAIQYRVLDIERDPAGQGFDAHGYDLVIASNVLHATRYLNKTLSHCRQLLRPSGTLLALEGLRPQGWVDLIFGQLDGWWRFADAYRPQHALASPEVWQRALADAGFEDAAVLGPEPGDTSRPPDRGVILARGPSHVQEPAGVWVLAGDASGIADDLAALLTARNQTVFLAGATSNGDTGRQDAGQSTKIVRTSLDAASRESWRALIESLPADVPLNGVVHLEALDGHGVDATPDELRADTKRVGGSALALTQGIVDADAAPDKGVWFLTCGAQVLERERAGQLSGALLWGFGRALTRETPHLRPRMIDLDPTDPAASLPALVNELLYPDAETHVAYRLGIRRAARLVRANAVADRLSLPAASKWRLQPDPGGVIESMYVLDLPEQPLAGNDVRIAVEAAGLNFANVLAVINAIETVSPSVEVCGRVVAVGPDVSRVSVGDRVVAIKGEAYGSEVVCPEELVAPAPEDVPAAALATMPIVFTTVKISFGLAGLKTGERVLIHAGSGGIGLSAIQLAQAAGAEVIATASAPKQAFLRSLGVKCVFDSRSTDFGRQILAATDGEGVHVILNSLTGAGFIEASLSCLAQGGRFVELSKQNIYTPEEMAAARPDVAYHVVALDALQPEYAGAALGAVMSRLAAGDVEPLIHTRWSMTEAIPAMKFMRDARHIGKIVLTNSPIETGQLREDRTYLVTGGLGGIGIAIAGWLADHGAGAIVLNGRRPPDPPAADAIAALQERGARIQVELADVTDGPAMDAMFQRIADTLPPLAGVIHSVGVLSDATLGNQTWDSFERVLWPKMIGAWHLHQATANLDLDLFTLFSSAAGVMGNSGQSNHSAANTFLDRLAAHRRALGLPGQAIAWGAWSELGEAEEQRERIADALEARGINWITPAQGMRAFEEVTRQNPTTSALMSVDWPRFAERIENVPPFFAEVVSEAQSSAPQSADSTDSADDLMSQLQAIRNDDPERILASFLQQELQAVMRLPTPPSPTVGFFDLGMDSLMSVELRNRLNRAFAGQYVVSNTAVFDHPNVNALARHLAAELAQTDAGPQAPPDAQPTPPAPRPAPGVKDDAIAIVGMACRFPGAPNLPAYWRLLSSGLDAITDGRNGANDWSNAVGDPSAKRMEHRRGGFVDGIEWFDSRFFRIAPIEARLMDPQQRLTRIMTTS